MINLPPKRFQPNSYHRTGPQHGSGHEQFVHDLIVLDRPSLIVTLGTQPSDLYFNICQAISENGLASQYFFVDTSESGPADNRDQERSGCAGASNAGISNAGRYSAFSYLVRATADEATISFAESTIDLLYLSGPAAYKAASQNLEAWLPKVKPGGVILLEGICLRQADFGAWRAWEELRGRFETFEFHHSRGLGVLKTPGGPETGFIASLVCSNEEEAAFLKHYYSSLELALEREAVTDYQSASAANTSGVDGALAAVEAQRLEKLEAQMTLLRAEAQRLQAERIALSSEYRRACTTILALEGRLEEWSRRLSREQDLRIRLEAEVQDTMVLAAQLEEWPKRFAREQRLRIQSEHNMEEARRQRAEILDSYSWRVTSPLRRVLALMPPLARLFRR